MDFAATEVSAETLRKALEVSPALDPGHIPVFLALLDNPENVDYFHRRRARLEVLSEAAERELLDFAGRELGFFSRLGRIFGSDQRGVLFDYFWAAHHVALILWLMLLMALGGGAGYWVVRRR